MGIFYFHLILNISERVQVIKLCLWLYINIIPLHSYNGPLIIRQLRYTHDFLTFVNISNFSHVIPGELILTLKLFPLIMSFYKVYSVHVRLRLIRRKLGCSKISKISFCKNSLIIWCSWNPTSAFKSMGLPLLFCLTTRIIQTIRKLEKAKMSFLFLVSNIYDFKISSPQYNNQNALSLLQFWLCFHWVTNYILEMRWDWNF